MEIWNDSAIDEYCDLFPYPKNTALLNCPGQFEDKLRSILAKISNYREEYMKLNISQQNKKKNAGQANNVGGYLNVVDEEEGSDDGHHCCQRKGATGSNHFNNSKRMLSFVKSGVLPFMLQKE